MAYFDCTIGSAGEFSIPLVVTCTANFAGKTITCSDGTTTLTGTCPSASPYEVEFELPNTGTWTVSGTISGHTYSDSVLVNEFDAELVDKIDITVDVYSAASDTLSYVGVDGQTHTVTTDSTGYASTTISILATGSTITFESSVALDPEDVTSHYSKSIALTSATPEVYLMPSNAIYWFGYKNSSYGELQGGAWHASGGTDSNEGYPNAPSVTWNTNYLHLGQGGSQYCGVSYYNKLVDFSQYSKWRAISKGCSITNATYRYQNCNAKLLQNLQDQYTLLRNIEPSVTQNGQQTATKGLESITNDITAITSSGYVSFYLRSVGTMELYAYWLEE